MIKCPHKKQRKGKRIYPVYKSKFQLTTVGKSRQELKMDISTLQNREKMNENMLVVFSQLGTLT